MVLVRVPGSRVEGCAVPLGHTTCLGHAPDPLGHAPDRLCVPVTVNADAQ